MYSAVIPFITSDQHGSSRHSKSALRAFKKRINLLQRDKYSTLKAQFMIKATACRIVNLTEREIKIISKKYCATSVPARE